MKLLLDTHILLWALLDDPRLPSTARRLIEDRGNKVYFSIVSPWEVQIKHQIHPDRLTLDGEALAEYCGDAGYLPMPVKLAHVFALGALKRKRGLPLTKILSTECSFARLRRRGCCLSPMTVGFPNMTIRAYWRCSGLTRGMVGVVIGFESLSRLGAESVSVPLL